jgi:uncharacterized protein YjiS (DUF1127 family)
MHSFSPNNRHDSAPAARAAGDFMQSLWRAVQRMVVTLLRWQELVHERQALMALDDRLLKDIGLSRADAVREARRSFWDDPLAQPRSRLGGSHGHAQPESVACCKP